jgi:GxxExxY protein
MIEIKEDVIGSVLSAAIEVHRELGPGLLESAYEAALVQECLLRELKVVRQQEVPLRYKGVELGIGFRADLIVEGGLLLELKVVDRISELHVAQIITYQKLLGIKRGLILNFNVPALRLGIRRVSI